MSNDLGPSEPASVTIRIDANAPATSYRVGVGQTLVVSAPGVLSSGETLVLPAASWVAWAKVGVQAVAGLAWNPNEVNDSLYCTDDVGKGIWKRTADDAWSLLSEDIPPGFRLRTPYGLSFDRVGTLWAVDYEAKRLLSYHPTSKQWAKIDMPSTFGSPYGIACRGESEIYISFTGTPSVQKYDIEARTWTELGTSAAPAFLNEPRGLALNTLGELWVADYSANCLRVRNPDGTWVPQGVPGSSPGQFSSPTGLTFDASGNLWVADYGNDRLQMRTQTETQTVWAPVGSKGTGPGQFKNPIDLRFDRYGNLWVADHGNARLQQNARFQTTALGKVEWRPDGSFIYTAGSVAGQDTLTLEVTRTITVAGLHAPSTVQERVSVSIEVFAPTIPPA